MDTRGLKIYLIITYISVHLIIEQCTLWIDMLLTCALVNRKSSLRWLFLGSMCVHAWTMYYDTFKRPRSIKSTRLNAPVCWHWNMIPCFGPWPFDHPGAYMWTLKKGLNLIIFLHPPYVSNKKKLCLHYHTNSKSHREAGVHDLICFMIPSALALWLSVVGWEDFYLAGKERGKKLS
jgi:hypothetical protein